MARQITALDVLGVLEAATEDQIALIREALGDPIGSGGGGGGTGGELVNNSVTNAFLADMVTARIKGRVAVGTGDPQDLTDAQVKTFLNITDVNNTSDANKPVSTATQTALNLKLTISALLAEVKTAWAVPTTGNHILGVKANVAGIYPVLEVASATCYHMLRRIMAGMIDQGQAYERWNRVPTTPVSGSGGLLTMDWPLDPALNADPNSVQAAEQANRTGFLKRNVVAANAASGVVSLVIPVPADTSLANAISANRTPLAVEITNTDPTASLTIQLAAPATGRYTSKWRGDAINPVLAAGARLRAEGWIWPGGLVELEYPPVAVVQFGTITQVGAAVYIDGATSATIPALAVDDVVVSFAFRTTNATPPTAPTGKGYVGPSGGDLNAGALSPGSLRSIRAVYTRITAAGDFVTGAWTNATRSLHVAFRNVESVAPVNAASNTTTPIAHVPLTPLSDQSQIVGFTTRNVSGRLRPANTTELQGVDAGNSHSLWKSNAQVNAWAPAGTAHTAVEWLEVAFALKPNAG